VTNWPEYDAALVRRGNLTVWLTDDAIAAWHAPATGKRGGQLIWRSRLVWHCGWYFVWLWCNLSNSVGNPDSHSIYGLVCR
jgi:hypothetical protein